MKMNYLKILIELKKINMMSKIISFHKLMHLSKEHVNKAKALAFVDTQS
jgi:hypothetical protein